MRCSIADLRNDIMAKDCDIVNVLRKAHVVASKLELAEFGEWIKHELEGYPNDVNVPEYRVARGDVQLKDLYGVWSPVCIPDPISEKRYQYYEIRKQISIIQKYLGEDVYIIAPPI